MVLLRGTAVDAAATTTALRNVPAEMCSRGLTEAHGPPFGVGLRLN